MFCSIPCPSDSLVHILVESSSDCGVTHCQVGLDKDKWKKMGKGNLFFVLIWFLEEDLHDTYICNVFRHILRHTFLFAGWDARHGAVVKKTAFHESFPEGEQRMGIWRDQRRILKLYT